jgi:hypothetical protein
MSIVVMAAACTREEPPAPAPQPPLVQADQAQPTLPERRAFPERAANLTPAPPRPAKAPKQVAKAPPEPAPVEPVGPPPLPFAYVGKLADGKERYAVLSQGQQVFVVRAGDSLLGRYRVEAVKDDQVLLLNLEFRVVQPLAFSGPTAAVGAIRSTTFPAGGGDGVSLQLAAPSQVAIGEQFTLTVSLDSGAKDTLETGTVELRFDPKVLQVSGSSSDAGSARLEISGAYMGHPAPATVQFIVVAGGPTATEIRVLPTNIADSDGRNVGVDAPPAHKLRIVRER